MPQCAVSIDASVNSCNCAACRTALVARALVLESARRFIVREFPVPLVGDKDALGGYADYL